MFVTSDNDPGTTYDREACEVAIRVTVTSDGAINEQARLIRKLKPRDNKLGLGVVLEPAPF